MISRLSRHTSLLLVSNIGGAALSFALSVLIGRVLGNGGLGAYTVVLAWVYPLSMVVEFGLATLATRDLSVDAGQSDAYLDAMVLARIVLGGAAVAALMVFAPLLSNEPAIMAGLVISAPMVIILPFYSAFTAVFKARGAVWPVPWLNIGMLVAQVVLTIIVLASGGGILAALIVNVLTSMAQLVAAWGIWRWKFRIASPPDPLSMHREGAKASLSLRVSVPKIGDLLRRAWPFALAALFAALQVRLSVILLEQIAGTNEVGYFAAANRFVEAGRMIPNAFFGALLPALASLAAQPAVLKRTFSRVMWALGAFGTAAALAVYLFAPTLIGFTYGEPFAPAASILSILMLSLAFSLLRGGRTLYWYALGREQQVNWVNGIVIVFQAALSLWLIPTLGAAGAAWALVAVEVAGLLLLWRDLRLPDTGRLRVDRSQAA